MIDYLEWLLDQLLDEEETEPFAWERTNNGYLGDAKKHGKRFVAEQSVFSTGQKEQGEKQAEWPGKWQMALAGLTQWTVQPEGKEDQRTAGVRVQEQSADPERRLLELSRAVTRGKSDRVIRERKSKSESGMSVQGRESVPRMNDTQLETRRGLANLLDVAFERDARRYDGPLGLF